MNEEQLQGSLNLLREAAGTFNTNSVPTQDMVDRLNASILAVSNAAGEPEPEPEAEAEAEEEEVEAEEEAKAEPEPAAEEKK